MFTKIHVLHAAAIAGVVATASASAQQVTPFTETFDLGSANFFDTGFAPVDFNPEGFISVDVPSDAAADMGLSVLRAEALLGASNGAFAGDYIEAGITQFFVDVRHDADFDIDLTARFSPIARFPGSFPLFSDTVAAGDEFTTLTFDIGSLSNVFFEGPSTPANFELVFGDVANIQLFTGTDLSGQAVTFDFDNFGIAVPEPASAVLLGAAGLLLVSRRRRIG